MTWWDQAQLQVFSAWNLIPASITMPGSVQDSQPCAHTKEKYRGSNTWGKQGTTASGSVLSPFLPDGGS